MEKTSLELSFEDFQKSVEGAGIKCDRECWYRAGYVNGAHAQAHLTNTTSNQDGVLNKVHSDLAKTAGEVRDQLKLLACTRMSVPKLHRNELGGLAIKLNAALESK